jgi:SAM-dependent methyltransferase
MATKTGQVGSASIQGELWSARADDWAELQEQVQRPMYGPVFDALGVGRGFGLLDAGCGSGVAVSIAAGRGARVAGLDAAPALVAIARSRVPDGDFRVGELEDLPYEDRSFDAVTSFNAFQYAASPVTAVREAGRVTKRGGHVSILVWGEAERCDAAAYVRALGSLLPPPPPGAPGPFALSEPGALEKLAADAGLEPGGTATIEAAWEYPDLEAALRGLLAGGPAVKAIRHAGEEAVRASVAAALKPFRTGDGGYRLLNTWRYLISSSFK